MVDGPDAPPLQGGICISGHAERPRACGHPRIKSGSPAERRNNPQKRKAVEQGFACFGLHQVPCTRASATSSTHAMPRRSEDRTINAAELFIGTACARSAFSHQEKSKKEIALKSMVCVPIAVVLSLAAASGASGQSSAPSTKSPVKNS
jgi:hypothetical protein